MRARVAVGGLFVAVAIWWWSGRSEAVTAASEPAVAGDSAAPAHRDARELAIVGRAVREAPRLPSAPTDFDLDDFIEEAEMRRIQNTDFGPFATIHGSVAL